MPASGLPNTSFESDETDPAQVYNVTDDNAENDNWEQARLDCISAGKHLCRLLNHFAYKKVKTSSHGGGSDVFQHRCTTDGEVTHFPENGVVVSALKHVPQLRSLLVGFNFGSWQIFDLASGLRKDSVVPFSSAYSSESALPVTAFVFQEPEDDPRYDH